MLEEIEVCLAGHPRVQDASVVEQGDRLVAYAVPIAGAALDEEQLRDFLKGRLPAYKMPRYFMVLDFMPLGPDGQVDHAALPDPQAVATATQASSMGGAGQASERARYLTDLWAELLHCPVLASDNFFDLGGHSMLAVQMANRVHRDTGVRIQLMTLATQSLAQIAATLPVVESGSATGPGLRSRLLGKFKGMLQG